jgi:hypothetical protein
MYIMEMNKKLILSELYRKDYMNKWWNFNGSVHNILEYAYWITFFIHTIAHPFCYFIQFVFVCFYTEYKRGCPSLWLGKATCFW